MTTQSVGRATRQWVMIWWLITGASLLFGLLAASFVNVGVREKGAVLMALALTMISGMIYVIRSLSRHPDVMESGLPWARGWAREKPLAIRLLNRLYLTVSGAERSDILVDVARFFGITMLTAVAIGHFEYPQHPWRPEPAVEAVTIFSLSLIALHLVYPIFRKPSRWEFEYRYRKILMATALNYASTCLVAPDEKALVQSVQRIEHTVLLAIKSYLEFIVSDRTGSNLTANLIVRVASEPTQLVCVARAPSDNPEREIPTFYEADSMTIVMRSLNDGRPIYIGDFNSRKGKKYRTVWHIPILIPDDKGEKVAAGLLAIDSLVPGHLDLLDNREVLLLNLAPYISLLRFSLQMRRKNRIIHSLALDRHMERIEAALKSTEYEFDRNVDLESLSLAMSNSDMGEDVLKAIIKEMQALTMPRRFFAALLPYVEASSRSVRI